MNIKDTLVQLKDEVQAVLDDDFTVEVVETKTVPNFEDAAITYDNLDDRIKRCKQLETCVLYIDIRNSAAISASDDPENLAKVYSAFVRSMIKCARYFGGHVRNIIGDRVMVIFDQENCFCNAIDTAILMNTVSQYIIDPAYSHSTFKCGIGIDYGKMLVTKAGATRKGAETEFYRSLVWLGTPANVASRLTDLAHKTIRSNSPGVHTGLYLPNIKDWIWKDQTAEDFIDQLEPTDSRMLRHKDEYFYTFFKTNVELPAEHYRPIMVTSQVYEGLKRDRPEEQSITNNWWHKRKLNIDAYRGAIYECNVHYEVGEQI